ncbi:Fur family transcriptional regulator [Desulfococcus sp.]|uniref:Fur family transcriptional regulator n=1 Tax=Desulfococcus sp. TaxID=2025834 RepID=UPI003593F24A
MDDQDITVRIAQFLETCRRHQLKITPQRVAIYRELVQSDMHPSADALYQTVRKEFPNISFDTVNRTLLTFANIGVANVVEIFGGAKRFDPNTTDHHHVHCIQCGKIMDFHHRHFDDLDDPEDVPGNFRILDKRIVLKGICNECSNNSR